MITKSKGTRTKYQADNEVLVLNRANDTYKRMSIELSKCESHLFQLPIFLGYEKSDVVNY